jgi:hypothetical protein
MKTLALSLLSIFTVSTAFSQAISLDDYKGSLITDIATKGISKEKLFSSMDRNFIKVGGSICSNRALMWLYDYKKKHDIDGAKIFLFYTKKTGEVGSKTWWYHVSPMVNENGKLWVMDAGFPSSIRKPLTQSEWLNKFIGSDKCKAIKGSETELIEKMFSGRVFPETTSYGTYDCYYKLTPAGYWTPASVAMSLLGVDESGTPVHYVRDEIKKSEVYTACTEAVTSGLGRIFGAGKKKCKEYID